MALFKHALGVPLFSIFFLEDNYSIGPSRGIPSSPSKHIPDVAGVTYTTSGHPCNTV